MNFFSIFGCLGLKWRVVVSQKVTAPNAILSRFAEYHCAEMSLRRLPFL